jgi:hypothetical protein
MHPSPTTGQLVDFAACTLQVAPVSVAGQRWRALGLEALFHLTSPATTAIDVFAFAVPELDVPWVAAHVGVDGRLVARFPYEAGDGWLWRLVGARRAVGFVADDLTIVRREPSVVTLPPLTAPPLAPDEATAPAGETRPVPAALSEEEAPIIRPSSPRTPGPTAGRSRTPSACSGSEPSTSSCASSSPCGTIFRGDEAVAKPIRLLLGTADDYVLGPCRAFVERLSNSGKDIRLIEYPDAHHVFDAPAFREPRKLAAAPTTRRCLMVEGDNGTVMNQETKQPFSYSDACVEKGADGRLSGGGEHASASIRSGLPERGLRPEVMSVVEAPHSLSNLRPAGRQVGTSRRRRSDNGAKRNFDAGKTHAEKIDTP